MLRFIPARRRTVAALASLVAVPLVLAGASVGTSAPPPAKEAPEEASVPIKADRDGDRIADDFEPRLAGLSPSERVSAIVTLTAPATSERVRGLERAVGSFAVTDRFRVVDAFVATLTSGQVRALARRPDVERVEANSPVRALNDGAQASFGVAKARTDAPQLDGDADGSREAYTAGDLVAAVIDTGVDAGHLDLDDGKVLAFKDFVNGRTVPYDDNGHGTHVAATIAGDGEARADRLHRGVAPDAALVGVKVLDAKGGGTMADVTAAIDWVVANKDVYGIEVVNLSLGASGCSDGLDATSRAVDAASAAGLLVVVAAGNDGPATCTIGAPGAAAGAVTVGAMADTAAGGFAQAWFSSRGPTADGRIKPDVSAPGVAITSAQANSVTGYVAHDGTSMATPFVAGVALLMQDASPGLTPAAVKEALRSTAVDWSRGGNNRTAGTTGPDIDSGAGRLDAYAALAAAGAPLTDPPAAPRHEVREGSLPGTGASVSYTLDVTDTSVPVAATLVLPSIAGAGAYTPDFDLYLYGPSGGLLDYAETTGRQEDVSARPSATGTYTLVVRSYSGSGPFFVDLSSGVAPATPAPPSGDAVPPTILAVAPADGATAVAPATNVTVTFDEAMDEASAEAAFALVAADGTSVAGTFTWAGNAMTFDPSANLASGASYRASVATNARDVAGNALATPTTSTFATETTVNATPASVTVTAGRVRSGDATRLRVDDDAYFQVNSATSGTRAADWYGRVRTVSNAVTKLTVAYKGKSSAACSQIVYVYDWTNALWTRLDSRSVGTTEVAVTTAVSGTLANYVSGTSGDGDVAVRIRCTRSDGVGFFVSGDLLRVTYTK